ncbi:MAG: hypothetical protein RI924_32, partial [Bacteroidota bacterium]
SGTSRYLFVLPGYESNFSVGSNFRFNSSGVKTDLESAKTTQDATVVVSISDPSVVIEASGNNYINFELSFSKSRATGNSISFTPTLIDGTAVVGSDLGSTIQYSLNNSTWSDLTSSITVTNTTNTVFLRVSVTDDSRPEVNENFVIKTNSFTESATTKEISNSSGTFSTGTIADNNDPLVWTGASNNSFGSSSNWNPNDLSPSVDYSISIPSGITNDPEVGNDVSIKDLVIQSGAKITINNNTVLSVKGNVSNDGQSLGEGTLELSGTNSQTISGTGAFKSLKIENTSGVTISNNVGTMVNMIGVLSINSGQLSTNGNLTFKSTASDEGILGTVNCSNAATINGNVIVERLIPGSQRAFRFLTPGVNTTGTIRDNWQEGQNNTSTVYASYQNNTTGYGTHITGSTTGANGFDATLTGNPSLFKFDNATQTWVSVSSTNNASTDLMKFGEAYRILIRGSRAVNMNTNTPVPDSTTIRTTGQLCYCETIFNSTGSGTSVLSAVSLNATTNAWSFIGNPYWAYVDWHTVTKQNVSNTYYVWDPTIAGTNGRGGFEAWIYNPGTNSGQKQNGTTSRLDRYIQPGQAFFVKTTGSSPSITFNETDKYTGSNGRKSIFSVDSPPVSNSTNSANNLQPDVGENRISILIYLKENLDKKAADAATLYYANGWSDELGVDDADKLNNPDENIALSRGAKNFAFEGKNPLSNLLSDSVDLKLWNLNARSYVLRINAEDYAAQHEIFLVDKLKGTEYRVNKGSIFDVSIAPVTGQRTLDNFYLLLRKPVLELSSTQAVTQKGFMVYPNPVTNELNLSLGSDIELQENSKLFISDFNGQRLLTADIEVGDGNSFSIDVSALTAGTYIVELISGKRRYTHKIIKK